MRWGRIGLTVHTRSPGDRDKSHSYGANPRLLTQILHCTKSPPDALQATSRPRMMANLLIPTLRPQESSQGSAKEPGLCSHSHMSPSSSSRASHGMKAPSTNAGRGADNAEPRRERASHPAALLIHELCHRPPTLPADFSTILHN